MTPLESFGHEPHNGRRLWFAAVERCGAVDSLDFPGEGFACLLLWDTCGVGADDVDSVAQVLIDAGCGHVLAWGDDCERVHDVIDMREVMRDIEGRPGPFAARGGIMLTSWHTDEPLALTVYVLSLPETVSEPFTCADLLVIAVDAPAERVERVRGLLADPGSLGDRAEAEVREIYRRLARLEGDVDRALALARGSAWFEEGLEPIEFRAADLRRALERFLEGSLGASQITEWAQRVESSECLEYEAGLEPRIARVLSELATPEIDAPIDDEIARALLDRVRGFPDPEGA